MTGTRHRLVGLALLAGALAPIEVAQAQPPVSAWPEGLIWDDFSYDTGAQATDPSEWCIVRPGRLPTRRDACAFENHQLWYETNWAERHSGLPNQLRARRAGNADQLELRLRGRQRYNWGGTPAIISGFTQRTGSWYARVRLQDLTRRRPGSTTSFWTMSPHWACADVTPGTSCSGLHEKYWSEWNYEWTSGWVVDRASPGPWLSTGAVVDGEASAVGGILLRADTGRPTLTCKAPTGEVLDWGTCRQYFINGTSRQSEDGPYADLLVRFDGAYVEWEAVAHANGRRLRHDYVRMFARSPRLGPGQPVMTLFTANPRMGERTSGDIWFGVDWFIYSPHTDKILDAFVETATWLRESARIDRLNSTGIRLERPTRSTGLHLETVSGDAPGTFLTIPPLNQLTYYDIFWSYRTTERERADGRPDFRDDWRELDDHSLKVSIPEVRQRRFSEVRVRYRLHRDAYGVHQGPIPVEPTGTACIASNDRGRTYEATCRD
ncbi:MAG TPA: hypothetical protein VF190_00770 [Rhodothermales bacterium]